MGKVLGAALAFVFAGCGANEAVINVSPGSDVLVVISGPSGVAERQPAAVSEPVAFVEPGGIIRFVNQDDEPHQIVSDPHPSHSGCPELNGPVLEPGDSISFQMRNEPVVCGYHDELAPDAVTMWGEVRVVPAQ